ncbi:MAG: hypothetical protein CR971_01245 [candidate division SR1 bacterium]|nr:MAG: hypothetical protein CR971_01245 [candidate division SR1 bacterium]
MLMPKTLFTKTRNASAFTLVEMIVVIVLFALVGGVLVSLYTSINKSQQEIGAMTALTEQTNTVFEFINYATSKYTIDYEEYWNRSRVGCDATDGNAFSWDVDANLVDGQGNGHCDKFTAYGNHNSAYTRRAGYGDEMQPLLYTCSSKESRDNGKYPVVFRESNLTDEKNGCFENNNISGKQAFGQYKRQFWDMMTEGVNNGNEQFLGKGPIAVEDVKNTKELYLISRDGTQRLLLRRNCKTYDGEKKVRCGIQILRLRAFDAGVDHTLIDSKSDDWGEYDGTIDTWACDAAQGFVCKGKEVGKVDGIVFNLPQDNDSDDGWVDLTSDDINIRDWNITISTPKDPKYSAQDPDFQAVPYVKVDLDTTVNSSKWGGLTETGRFAISTNNMFGFNSDIYTTEISTYKGDCGKQLLICPTNVRIQPKIQYITQDALKNTEVEHSIVWNPGVYDTLSLVQSGDNLTQADSSQSLGIDGNSFSVKTNAFGTYTYYFEIGNKKLWDFCPPVPVKKRCGIDGALTNENIITVQTAEKKTGTCSGFPSNATQLNTKIEQKCISRDAGGSCTTWSPDATVPYTWDEDGNWNFVQTLSSPTDDTFFWQKDDKTGVKNGCFFLCPEGEIYDDTKKACISKVVCSDIDITNYTRVNTKGGEALVSLHFTDTNVTKLFIHKYNNQINTSVQRLVDEPIERVISIDSGHTWTNIDDSTQSFSGVVASGQKVQALMKYIYTGNDNKEVVLKTCGMYKDKTSCEVNVVCKSNEHKNADGQCERNTKRVACATGAKWDHTVWNPDGTYTKIWNEDTSTFSTKTPHYDENPKPGDCRFTCDADNGWSKSPDVEKCVVNGVCGNAHTNNYTSKPTTDLCKWGSATSVSGGANGPWTWKCTGKNGGNTSQQCQANKTVFRCEGGTVPSATNTTGMIMKTAGTSNKTWSFTGSVTSQSSLGHCQRGCESNYHKKSTGNSCEKNTKTVKCEQTGGPAHSEYIDTGVDLTVTWNGNTWSATPECEWTCKDGYEPNAETNPTACVKVEYLWDTGLWSACDGAEQHRTVQCINKETHEVVSDEYCDSGMKPNVTQQCVPEIHDCTGLSPESGEGLILSKILKGFGHHTWTFSTFDFFMDRPCEWTCEEGYEVKRDNNWNPIGCVKKESFSCGVSSLVNLPNTDLAEWDGWCKGGHLPTVEFDSTNNLRTPLDGTNLWQNQIAWDCISGDGVDTKQCSAKCDENQVWNGSSCKTYGTLCDNTVIKGCEAGRWKDYSAIDGGFVWSCWTAVRDESCVMDMEGKMEHVRIWDLNLGYI